MFVGLFIACRISCYPDPSYDQDDHEDPDYYDQDFDDYRAGVMSLPTM